MANGSSKFASFSVFCKMASQALNMTKLSPLPAIKLTGFESITETNSGKSGVDMSTPSSLREAKELTPLIDGLQIGFKSIAV